MTEDELFIAMKRASPQKWHYDRISSKRTVNTILWRGGGYPPIFINIQHTRRASPPPRGGFKDAQHLGIVDVKEANISVILICETIGDSLHMAKVDNPYNPFDWKSYKSMERIVEGFK